MNLFYAFRLFTRWRAAAASVFLLTFSNNRWMNFPSIPSTRKIEMAFVFFFLFSSVWSLSQPPMWYRPEFCRVTSRAVEPKTVCAEHTRKGHHKSSLFIDSLSWPRRRVSFNDEYLPPVRLADRITTQHAPYIQTKEEVCLSLHRRIVKSLVKQKQGLCRPFLSTSFRLTRIENVDRCNNNGQDFPSKSLKQTRTISTLFESTKTGLI